MRQRGAFLLLAVGSVLSCTDTTGPRESLSGAPRRDLVDGRNGGAPDFYFLSPLASAITYASPFDGTRSPIVEICPLSQAGQCGAVVARFTMTNGKGLDRTRIEVKGQHYVVKWKTKESDLSLNQTYRIRVLEGSSELGHVDTRMVKKDKDARSLPAGVVGIVLGSTLPIKFRLSASNGGPAVRLEIHPGTFLLTGAGQQQPLEVSAFDAQGRPTGGQVVWHSSNEAVMTMSGDGVAQAVAGSGSAQVTAQIGTATSAPALGIVTQPAAGALLISDDDVVGATVAGSARVATAAIVPIVPVDPNASYALGWQYRVHLTGVNPIVGQILLTTGELPVGGRVVSVAPDGNEVEVTLALVTIAEMFPTLSINESIPLHQSEMDRSLSISANYSATQQPGGRIDFERRNFSSFGSGWLRQTVLNPVGPRLNDIELEIGPFDCKISGAVGTSVSPSLGNFSYHVDPDLTLDLVFTPSNGLEKLIVRGGVEGGITFSPLFPLAMEEKIECKVQLATIVLPIGGPLSLLVGGQIPIGVGFELGGKLSIGNVGYDASMTAGVNMSLGIDCTAGCKPVSDLNGSATGSFKPIIPSSSDGRSELSATGFAWAELAIGNSFFNALQFKAFEAKAGLKQNFLIASPTAQVIDPAYASSFKFSFDVEAGTGSSIGAVAGLLGINLSTLKLENSTPLAESPRKQSFTISPATVRAQTLTDPGEKANFILTLDPVTYFGFYAVDSVELYRKKPTGPGTFVLEQVPGGCGQIAPTNGQSAFSCETFLPQSWAGNQTVYAFVKPKLFGVSLPLLLEIAEDGMAALTVDTTVTVVVSPASPTVAPAGTQQFTATVSGPANTAVTWGATGGTISPTGLYTAGATPGSYKVMATSVANSSVTDTAEVTIGAPASVSYQSNNSRAEATALATAIADNGAGYGEEYSFNETTPIVSNALTIDTTLSVGGATVTDGQGAQASASGIASLKMELSQSPSGSLIGGIAAGSVNVATLRQDFPEATRGGATASAGAYFEITFKPLEAVILRWNVQGQDPCGPPFVPEVNTGLWVDLDGPLGTQTPIVGEWVGSISFDRELRLSAGSTYTMTATVLCSGARTFNGTGIFTTSFTISPVPPGP